MPRHVPGHRMPQIEPVHADGTVCQHPTAPSGKPRDTGSGCTGRHHYRASCECGWEQTDSIRESLKYARERHRDQARRATETATAPSRAAAPTASASPEATPASTVPADTYTVTVIHGRAEREISYRPASTVWSLLAEAVRAHGKRFSQNPGLRLHNHGQQLVNTATAEAAGIKPGDTLNLAMPGTLPKAEA